MQRDNSIDILKFIAALLITWSHFDLPLGEYSYFATGGTFGDVLFFFCSGYTLLLSKNVTISFFDWYKRRINRIYPTVFAWALVNAIFLQGKRNLLEIILYGGEWFISCIMIYYIAIWFVRKYSVNMLYWVIIIVSLLAIVWYFVIGTGSENNSMYGDTYFKWLHYFIYMLLGAIYGLLYKDKAVHIYPLWKSIVLIFICIILFYALFSFYNRDGMINAVQLLSLLPLAGFCIGSYCFCNSSYILGIYENKFGGIIIKFIGGLCLEIYLVQGPFLTDKLNSIFPLNIVVLFFAILIAAYFLRCLSRIWSQTFKDGNYCFKEIVKPY